MKTSAPPFLHLQARFWKGLLAAVLGLGWAASAAAIDLTGWQCMPSASCGTQNVQGTNDPVTVPPTEPYGWVSTAGGLAPGVVVIPDTIKTYNGGTAASGVVNASRIDSPVFHANANQILSFNFNYITSDGGPYPDFAWARLVDMDGHDVAILFTARTMPSGTIVPGANLPPLPLGADLTLTPPSTPILTPPTGYSPPAPGPNWAPLGVGSAGLCYAAGCGYTGWVHAEYKIPATGNYRLEFGVANWTDTAYNSGLAFYGAMIGGIVIEEEAKPDLVPHLTGPHEVVTDTHDHYTVTITNQGGQASTAGTIAISLPTGGPDPVLDPLFMPLPAGCTANPAMTILTCDVGPLASGASTQIEFVITSPTTGAGAITAAVSGVAPVESNLDNNTAQLDVNFVPPPGQPDLTPAITGPIDLPMGATGDYTVTVTNLGNIDSTDGLLVIALPTGVTLDASLLPTYCTAAALQITCDLSNAPPIPIPPSHHVDPGDDLTVTFRLTATVPNNPGAITATVSHVTNESDITNNQATRLLNNTRIIPRDLSLGGSGAAIPALDELALLLLALTLAGSAAAGMRRRRGG